MHVPRLHPALRQDRAVPDDRGRAHSGSRLYRKDRHAATPRISVMVISRRSRLPRHAGPGPVRVPEIGPVPNFNTTSYLLAGRTAAAFSAHSMRQTPSPDTYSSKPRSRSSAIEFTDRKSVV